jgi:hypothetical protein
VPGEALVEGLDQPDQDGADDRAREVADPAEDGGRERDQAEREARVVADVELDEVKHGADPCERPRERERERDRAVDVDAHDRRRLRILGGRAHRLSLARGLHEPAEQDEHRRRHERDEERVPAIVNPADLEDAGARDQRRHAAEVDAVDRERDVLDDERHPDGRDQDGQAGRVP